MTCYVSASYESDLLGKIPERTRQKLPHCPLVRLSGYVRRWLTRRSSQSRSHQGRTCQTDYPEPTALGWSGGLSGKARSAMAKMDFCNANAFGHTGDDCQSLNARIDALKIRNERLSRQLTALIEKRTIWLG